jgi:hypothetical protein
VATRHAWACQLTLPRHVNGRLRPGLDGMLSAPVARSVKWATRGPHRRAVGTGFQVAQREARWSADCSADQTPHCRSGDMTAPWCKCIGGGTVKTRNRHLDGSGNSPATTCRRGAGEDLREEGLDR